MNSEQDVPDLGLDEGPLEDAPQNDVSEAPDIVIDASQDAHATHDPELSHATANGAEGGKLEDDHTIQQREKEEPSTPDDTPSLQDSLLSSPRRPRLGSPGHSFRPFDRRFTTRLSPSPLASPRPASPAFLTGRSRQSSALYPFPGSENGDPETSETPWEVFRWTKLRQLSSEAFSELGKRKYGRPVSMAVASLIAIGTSKGLILIFDYHQSLKSVIGLGTKAVESGAVTAIALSADYSTVAGGHANGNIFTWEIARPAKPFLSVSASSLNQVQGSDANSHVTDASVLHIGFLGTRHTALVSADVKGMAFSHLATRGLGAIARSVRTSRILGRYPDPLNVPTKPRKPSSVLAFSCMPLGNSESAIDDFGLVAMLTPYLLVIVSTTPIAQTHHKAPRPKELTAHGAMTGCLAWYPAMKSKSGSSYPKLAYCWLNTVTIIEVIEMPNEAEPESPPDLSFKNLKRWQTEESIVAMQWLNRSVLAILTLTQQLIVLEDSSMAVTDSSDLIKRHVYHSDLYSQQLSHLIETLDQEDSSMHGVVADAFYMSLKSYKGRLFLLGFNDVAIGTLSNWADRLLALMQQGEFIGAIQLATSYYTGGPEKAAIGLPLDEESRHQLVQEKLLEMMAASLKYAFGKNPDAEARISDVQLDHLARACFNACMQLNDMDFLFDEVYTWYAENEASQIFLDILESYVADGEIRTVPPIVLKDLVNAFVSKKRSSKLEEILCLLDPVTMDLEQVTILCRKFKLYDALFYIWSQAIGDYTTVLKNLLAQSHQDDNDENEYLISKIFPFLSYTLTGRIYPIGDEMPDETAFKAKAEVYHFLFSGSKGESYLNLRQALDLDTSSFLSMLNEAYEDSFLDGNPLSNSEINGFSAEERFSTSLTRQYIIRVLLEVLVPPNYELEDTIYLDMFIARNQPKFPQFIRLPGNVLQRVMVNLCLYPSEEIAEDCQLSLEYLLSVYQPPDISSLIPDLEEAKFYRVIKSIYKSERQYSKLLETCFQDIDNPSGIFDCLRDYLDPSSELISRQRDEFRTVIGENVGKMLSADLAQSADLIEGLSPELHPVFIEFLDKDEYRQYKYLRRILESRNTVSEEQRNIHDGYVEKYIRLLCDNDPHHVSSYIDSLDTNNLRLDHIIPTLENSGVIDAAVILMAKGGHLDQAMKRLTRHLKYLEVALGSLFEGAKLAPDMENLNENANDLIESVEKYNKVGIWLCNIKEVDKSSQTNHTSKKKSDRVVSRALEEPLHGNELLWLDLLHAVVGIAKHSTEDSDQGIPSDMDHISTENSLSDLVQRLRNVVQDTFTALLAATSASLKEGSNANLSFLRILRAFLSRMSESSPSLVHLRGVLSSVFSAYAYEENLLRLSNRLLDKDLFVRVEEVVERRKRGWRPSGQVCNGCQKRVWGPGAGVDAWDAWYRNEKDNDNESAGGNPSVDVKGKQKDVYRSDTKSKRQSSGQIKGKGKEALPPGEVLQMKTAEESRQEQIIQNGVLDITSEAEDRLMIFSCRHIWHERCLPSMVKIDDSELTKDGTPPRCPLETAVR